MALINIDNQTDPTTPSSGKTKIYVDSTSKLIKSIDDGGTVTQYASGDVTGPGSSTDNAIARFDGTGGLTLQNSGVTIDDSDNVIIPGNLQVDGTTTTVNSTTLDVADANITVNVGGNDATSEGSGLTVERASTDGSLVYEDALASKFKIGALGSEIEVADVSSTQTFTNKTMSGSLNTFTNIDHGTQLTGLSDDDHTQYALLAGRSGGQTLEGGTDASDDLTLSSTSNGTKGNIVMGSSVYDEVNNRLGIGESSPLYKLDTKVGAGSQNIWRAQRTGENIAVLVADASENSRFDLLDGSGNTDIRFNTGGDSYINTGSSFGIGTTTPGARLEVAGTTGATAQVRVSRYSSDASSGFLAFRKARGTEGTPTAISSSDPLMSINAQGYDGSSFINGSKVVATATEAWSVGNNGTKLDFYTTPNGSATAAIAMSLGQNKRATFSGFINVGTGSELTIATGAVTATSSYHYIDTESDAATDDLDTINGGADGDILYIRAIDSSRTVVVKDATGNLQLNGDFSMDNIWDCMKLLNVGGSNWVEVSRSNNGA